MATAAEAPVDAMPNEPEANKLFRMVMRFKGSDLHLKVGHGPRDAAGRRAAADAASRAHRRRDGTADVPAALSAPEEHPGGHRRHRLRPHHLRTQRR